MKNLLLLLVIVVVSPVFADDAESVEQLSRVLRAAAQKAIPCVVHLETRVLRQRSIPPKKPGTTPESTFRQIEETGSGIVISIKDKPWVITNRHVVGEVGTDSIQLVLADHRILTATKILTNMEFDLAIIGIAENDVPVFQLGDSDKVEIADLVLVLGSPFGLSQSVSMGIISGKNRCKIPQGDQPVPLYNLLQTDTAVNPGNSGGPLVNTKGEVIGIVTAIASSSGANEGVGFAIPINDVMRLAGELIETGKILRPSLGVELAPEMTRSERKNAGLLKQIGVKVTKVYAGSPAEKVGIQVGDIIVRYHGEEVENDAHLVRMIARSKTGDTPPVIFIRGKGPFEVKPTLATLESR